MTVGSEELKLNHCAQVDTLFIHGRAAIHMADESTHVCSESFLKKQSTEHTWLSIRELLRLTHLLQPDLLSVDNRRAYTSQETKVNTEAQGINLNIAPVEAPGSIGVV